jgi:hypothetical protein
LVVFGAAAGGGGLDRDTVGAGVIANLILFSSGALANIPLSVQRRRGDNRFSGDPAFGVRRRFGRRGGAAARRVLVQPLRRTTHAYFRRTED